MAIGGKKATHEMLVKLTKQADGFLLVFDPCGSSDEIKEVFETKKLKLPRSVLNIRSVFFFGFLNSYFKAFRRKKSSLRKQN